MTDREYPVGVDPEVVLGQIKIALQIVQSEANANLVPLKSVQLSLNTVATRTAEGKPAFTVPVLGWEVGGGAKLTKEVTHHIDIKLIPPKPKTTVAESAEDVANDLIVALRLIRDTALAAEGEPNSLELEDGSAEIKFAVTKEGSISVAIVGAGASAEETHSMIVKVGKGS